MLDDGCLYESPLKMLISFWSVISCFYTCTAHTCTDVRGGDGFSDYLKGELDKIGKTAFLLL
jgi:hypothetical protein